MIPRTKPVVCSHTVTCATAIALLMFLPLGCGSYAQGPLGDLVKPSLSDATTRKGKLPPNMLSAAQALARLKADRNTYFLTAQEEAPKSLREFQSVDASRANRTNKLVRGDTKYKEIALTFDDGPHTGYTDQILTILRKYDVPATFFVVGAQAEKLPEWVIAEELDGHLVANHTYHHVSLPKIPQEYVAAEVMACGSVISNITGKTPTYFRPPGGEYNKTVSDAADALGYTMVLWTDDPGDYASPGADIILKRTLSHANPGGIILLHDGIAQTVQILPQLIETLKKQGYTFVRVDKMHRAKAVSPLLAFSSALKLPLPKVTAAR